MYDKELVKNTLLQIQEATKTIIERFEPVKSVDDFIDSSAGREKLDSICMLFVAIGESLKNIDKITNKELLKKYDDVNWKDVKGIRDIISHHYFDIDAEAIYEVCTNHISILEKTLSKIIKDL